MIGFKNVVTLEYRRLSIGFNRNITRHGLRVVDNLGIDIFVLCSFKMPAAKCGYWKERTASGLIARSRWLNR